MKKIRFKFVAIIMIVMTLLIAVVFAVICALDYQRAVDELNNGLENAIETSWLSLLSGHTSEANGSSIHAPRSALQGATSDENASFPVSVYSLTNAGAFTLVRSTSPYTLSDDVLKSALQDVQGAPDGNGFLPDLKLAYAKRSLSDLSVVAFTDIAAVSGWQSLARTLAIVGICTLAVIFGISVAFAKWALRPVEDAWNKQQRFISDASHELKTPLTVLSANMSILQKNMDKTIASESQWVESSQEELANMRELVDEMLFIASTDETSAQARGTQHHEPQDLSKLVKAQVLQFESRAFEKHIELEAHIEDGITLTGDRARLQRLVRTLLDNACKYAGAGEHVDVSLSRSGSTIIFAVANSGTHIAAEDLPHIFERFYRADKARARTSSHDTNAHMDANSRNNDGASNSAISNGAIGSGAIGNSIISNGNSYGLGLSIARDIAREHGGELSATSAPDEGTIFTVRWKE